MANVVVRSYLSPTLVLLAMDWPDGANRQDFLGFSIRRSPGFRTDTNKVRIDNKDWNWLPNRIGFDGAAPEGRDFPSSDAPIQKFMWWDARIDEDQLMLEAREEAARLWERLERIGPHPFSPPGLRTASGDA